MPKIGLGPDEHGGGVGVVYELYFFCMGRWTLKSVRKIAALYKKKTLGGSEGCCAKFLKSVPHNIHLIDRQMLYCAVGHCTLDWENDPISRDCCRAVISKA